MLENTNNIVMLQNNIKDTKHHYNIQIKVILLHTNITRDKTTL